MLVPVQSHFCGLLNRFKKAPILHYCTAVPYCSIYMNNSRPHSTNDTGVYPRSGRVFVMMYPACAKWSNDYRYSIMYLFYKT